MDIFLTLTRQSILNLRLKTEPVTASADATVVSGCEHTGILYMDIYRGIYSIYSIQPYLAEKANKLLKWLYCSTLKLYFNLYITVYIFSLHLSQNRWDYHLDFEWLNLRPDLGNIFLLLFFTKILRITWRRFIHMSNIMPIFFICYGNNETMHKTIYE